MAEGEGADDWAETAKKITAIRDYTKENEFLSQLLDTINGLAYPVPAFNAKVLVII